MHMRPIEVKDIDKKIRDYTGKGENIDSSLYTKIKIIKHGPLPIAGEEPGTVLIRQEDNYAQAYTVNDDGTVNTKKEIPRVELEWMLDEDYEEISLIGSAEDPQTEITSAQGVRIILKAFNKVTAGGIDPLSIGELLRTYVKLDNGAHYSSNVQLLAPDLESMLPYANPQSLAQRVYELSKERNENIYIASLPTEGGHQASMVFDNKMKIVYLADSKGGDRSADFKKLGLKVVSQEVALQSVDDINCGFHTLKNTLEKASELSHARNNNIMQAKILLDQDLIRKSLILDTFPTDAREFVDSQLLEKAVSQYSCYVEENDPAKKVQLAKEINQGIFAELSQHVALKKEEVALKHILSETEQSFVYTDLNTYSFNSSSLILQQKKPNVIELAPTARMII